jgi:hypothetical protein
MPGIIAAAAIPRHRSRLSQDRHVATDRNQHLESKNALLSWLHIRFTR